MIVLDEVSRVYDVGEQKVHALDHVTLSVEAGEYVALMGPSGSGKSTLLHIVGLLDRATAGTYRLSGRDVTSLDDDEQARLRSEEIGFIFQFFHLVPYLSALENVELPMVLAGVDPKTRHDRAEQALEAMGLGDRILHRPEQLSGGQRQRVAIARATVMHPSLLLADEPTGNLDRKSGIEVVEELERLNAGGLTVIVVTHDPQLGKRAARRIHLVDGRIEEDERS